MKASLLSLAVVVLLPGCSTYQNVAKRQDSIAETQSITEKLVQDVREKTIRQPRPTVRYIDEQWVSLKPIMVTEKIVEPELECSLNLRTNAPVTIFEFSQIVTKYCGITVRVTPDAISAIESPMASATTAQAPNPAQIAVPFSSGQQPSDDDKNLIDINYNGKLRGLLDMVTARFGVLWKAEGSKRVKIYNVDTQTFRIHTLAGSTDMTSVVQSGTTLVNGAQGGGGGGGSGGGTGGGGAGGGIGGNSGSNQTTTVSLKTSIWEDIRNVVESMKSPKGTYAISQGMGSITVTDNADVLQRVGDYVRKQNETLSKQVAFNVQVVSVTTDTTDQLGISWDAVYRTVSGKFGFSLSNASGLLSSGASGGFSIVDTTSSPWAGSQAIVSALAEQGGVQIVRKPVASTLNLQPVSVQVARQDGFNAGGQIATTAQVGTTTTIQTGIVTTGFNMSLLPYVLEDDRMLLQFSINLSSLRNLRTITSNGATAEVPEVDLPINSTQKVRLRAGETLVLAGFDQLDDTARKTGVGSPNNIALGGAVKGGSSKSTLVVLITPEIME